MTLTSLPLATSACPVVCRSRAGQANRRPMSPPGCGSRQGEVDILFEGEPEDRRGALTLDVATGLEAYCPEPWRAQRLPKVGINTAKGSEEEELDMDERISCSVCRRENPPENRYCGSCGTALADSGQLVPRRDHSPAPTVRSLPAKLGPSGKALAVGLAALAAEAGMLWLRRRVERADPTPLPAVQDSGSPVSEYLLSRRLEEVFVWLQTEDSRSHIFARREVRSFDVPKPPDGRG